MLRHLLRVFMTPFFKQYLQKGSKVLVRGEHRHREWERQNGSHACRCEILADEVVFV
ncbi:MAG: single-stranded DNA-binding protein, partial [Chloroflexi bacterium]|nr:single-stranded DNA-binding protein [Chloroflexota bacterium]